MKLPHFAHRLPVKVAVGVLLPLTLGLLMFALFSSRGKTLDDAALAGLVGGDGCKDCRYNGQRIDECYHYGYFDACSTTACIANYMIDYTCDLGAGTCNAILDASTPAIVQYTRQDTNCTNNNAWSIHNWVTSYYGSGCDTRTPTIRCEKVPSNGCNGTLIGSTARYPGIRCQ